MKQWFARLVPFLTVGIFLVILAFGLMLLFYLLIFGALVGAVLFAISWIRAKFFAPKSNLPVLREGRTFDHDDH